MSMSDTINKRYRIGKDFRVEKKVCPINWDCKNNGFTCLREECKFMTYEEVKEEETQMFILACLYFPLDVYYFVAKDYYAIRNLYEFAFESGTRPYTGKPNRADQKEGHAREMMVYQRKVKFIRRFYPECLDEKYRPKKKEEIRRAIVLPDGKVRVEHTFSFLEVAVRDCGDNPGISEDDCNDLQLLFGGAGRHGLYIDPDDFDLVLRSLPNVKPHHETVKVGHEKVVQHIVEAIDEAKELLRKKE
jgi:hypothetical protein